MRTVLILASLSVALLTACGRDPAPAATPNGAPGATTSAPQTMLGRQVESALGKARDEMRRGNLNLTDGVSVGSQMHRKDTSGLPKGEITPAGDLLVDGKPVPVDAAQRALLLEYRNGMLTMIEAGMALGVQGADLGMQAAGEAIRGIFSGNPEQIEQRIEKQAAGIEAQAEKLCDQLPAIRATQDRLAASLPAFKPYARMDQSDIDNCRTSARDDATRAQVQQEIRDTLRSGIRDNVRSAAQAAVGADASTGAGNAAEQAEADATTR